jgi:parallel beta-helix repeat protein
VAFSNLTVVGASGTMNGVGAFVRSSDHVTVANSEFGWLGSGIAHLDDTNLTISGNTIHDINVDGVVGAGSSNVVVSGNSFTSFHPGEGDHPDAIQFFADGTLQSSNVLIADNVITRGSGDPIQGVFIENTNHIEITGNAMSGTMYNGISVSASSYGLISNNYVQGWTDMSSGIIVRGGSANVSLVNDTSQGIANYAVDGVNPNYTETGSTLISAAAVNSLTAMTSWLSHHVASTASLSDPFFLH